MNRRVDVISSVLLVLSLLSFSASFYVAAFVDEGFGIMLAAAACYTLLLAVFFADYAWRRRG